MSNGLNKILGFMKLNDDEYDDSFDEFAEAEAKEPVKKKTSSTKKKTTKTTATKTKSKVRSSYDDLDDFQDDDEYEEPRRTSKTKRSHNKIVHMNAPGYTNVMEVRVTRPVDFESCQEISDIILDNKAAVINFEAVTPEEAQRIIDFVSGACYAIDGTLKMVTENIVVVTPNDIDITGDFPGEEGSDVNVPDFDDDDYYDED